MEELSTLVTKAREREIATREMKERLEARLQVPYASGLWTVDPTFISFVSAIASHYVDQSIPMIDSYGVPRMVNPSEMLPVIIARYQEAINEFHSEYVKVSRIR